MSDFNTTSKRYTNRRFIIAGMSACSGLPL